MLQNYIKVALRSIFRAPLAVDQDGVGGVPQVDHRRREQAAVGGPGVCALRALARITGGASSIRLPDRRHWAGRIGWAFRSLFNSPDVMSLLRGMNGAEPYWRRASRS